MLPRKSTSPSPTELQAELNRLRAHIPPDILREYDRRYHGGK